MYRRRIRKLRKHYGFTKEQLAKYLDISVDEYCNIECGDHVVYLSVVHKLADLYDCSEEFILCRVDDYEPMDLSHCFVPIQELDLEVLGVMNRTAKNLKMLRRLEDRHRLREELRL